MRLLKFIFSRVFLCVFVIAALVAAITFLCFYIHSLLPAAAAVVFSYSLSVIAVLMLLSGGSPAEFKICWLILIVALPVAGAIMYFVSYHRRADKCFAVEKPEITGCDGYEYFDDGATFCDRLITLVSAAKKQVMLEFYIISKGHIWGSLYRELKKALERGVEVYIIYDALGSASRVPKADFKTLKRAGAKIKIFNKLVPLPVSRLNFRDHRKIAVIDGDAVFLGGVNIADEYANLVSPHGFWKDGGAVFFGQIALRYRKIFKAAFYGDCCDDDEPEADRRGKMQVLPVADSPTCRGSICEDLIAGAVYAAKERVLIFTPYLCMGEKLHDAFKFAAGRGVDVKIIIPGIPDKKLTYAITRTYCDSLCADGIKIYVYTPGFIHVKCVICDGSVLIGSYNLDYRSMRLNYECGVWCGQPVADEAARDFNACLALCSDYRPRKMNAGTRILHSIAYLFAPLV